MQELENFKQEFTFLRNSYLIALKNKEIYTLKQNLKSDYPHLDFLKRDNNLKGYVSIFKADFDNPELINNICSKYGSIKNYKSPKKSQELEATIQVNCASFVSNRFLFRLKIDYQNQKIILLIYDKNYNLLDQKAYWSFKNIEKHLKKKKKYLIDLKIWSKTENNQNYYRFYDANYYRLIPFSKFLELLDIGKINVYLNFKYNKKKNQVITKNKLSFQILKINILDLYEKIT